MPDSRAQKIRRSAQVDVVLGVGALGAAIYAWLVRGISAWIVAAGVLVALVEIADAVYSYRWIRDPRIRAHTFAWALLFRVLFAGSLVGFVAFFGLLPVALAVAFAAYWIGDPVFWWALKKRRSRLSR